MAVQSIIRSPRPGRTASNTGFLPPGAIQEHVFFARRDRSIPHACHGSRSGHYPVLGSVRFAMRAPAQLGIACSRKMPTFSCYCAKCYKITFNIASSVRHLEIRGAVQKISSIRLESDRFGWQRLRFNPKRESASETESLIGLGGSACASTQSVNQPLKQRV